MVVQWSETCVLNAFNISIFSLTLLLSSRRKREHRFSILIAYSQTEYLELLDGFGLNIQMFGLVTGTKWLDYGVGPAQDKPSGLFFLFYSLLDFWKLSEKCLHWLIIGRICRRLALFECICFCYIQTVINYLFLVSFTSTVA